MRGLGLVPDRPGVVDVGDPEQPTADFLFRPLRGRGERVERRTAAR